MALTVDLLRREHANHRKMLSVLERQLTGETDYDVVKAIVDYFLTFPSRHHHPKEDVVFRRLETRAPDVAGRVGDLIAEHADLDAYVSAFAGAVENVLIAGVFPREIMIKGGTAFIDAMRRHMTDEEKQFFDVADEVLTDEDWAAIDVDAASFNEQAAVDGADGDLAVLRNEILHWSPAAR